MLRAAEDDAASPRLQPLGVSASLRASIQTRLAIVLTLATLLAPPAQAAKKLPPCPPKAAQLFIAPMGEPFRAGPDAPDPMTVWFVRLDADRDGRITPAEFAADADRFFARLDTDRDGELIPSEVTAYERDIAPEIRLYTPRGAAGMRPPTRAERKKAEGYGDPLGAGRWAFLNIPEPVAAADADFNRGVSLAEFRAAAADRFAQLDKAKAGALTLATLPKTPAQSAATNCDPTRVAPPPKRPR
ncbi:hypothetical protein [Sphingomonas profundi]|uniref:hypothetical protein n=1 Tax=Alterirhizorhabdus profundi TaxID=2681549 RepID=UPI001E332ECE|nr:hypothetical protein [Sphingomonas profundi]